MATRQGHAPETPGVVIGNHTPKYTARNPAIRLLTERWVANLDRVLGQVDRGPGGPPARALEVGCGEGVIAGLDMVKRAPAADLPPAHVGIHSGPVSSQDGDVYGKTVNVAARIAVAAYARAGQVVVSEETARRSGDPQLRLEPLGAVDLKGVAKPLRLYQAFRSS